MRVAAVTGLLLVAAVQAAAAADFATGLAAYRGGDYETALREWRPLAEQGMAEAQFNLGLMYFYGQGVEQSDREAARWYRQAAERGFAKAQFNLGNLYDRGRGVEQDDVQAHLWFNLARDQKFPGARKRRRQVAARMTAREIALAEMLYREWKQERKE